MSVYVRDFVARAGANDLGTMKNFQKMSSEIPVHEPSNGLVKPPQATLALLIPSKSNYWANCMCRKEQ